MPVRRYILPITTVLFSLLVLTGCFTHTTRLRQDQVIDITWETLQPSTSSQSRGNWRVKDILRVYGRDVVTEFSALQVSNCPGPNPPENSAIRSSSEYWFVRVEPLEQVGKKPDSTTPDTIAPEPLIKQAQFLIDPFSGAVVARRYICQ